MVYRVVQQMKVFSLVWSEGYGNGFIGSFGLAIALGVVFGGEMLSDFEFLT